MRIIIVTYINYKLGISKPFALSRNSRWHRWSSWEIDRSWIIKCLHCIFDSLWSLKSYWLWWLYSSLMKFLYFCMSLNNKIVTFPILDFESFFAIQILVIFSVLVRLLNSLVSRLIDSKDFSLYHYEHNSISHVQLFRAPEFVSGLAKLPYSVPV